MDLQSLIKRLKAELKNKVLDIGFFGRSHDYAIWVQTAAIPEIARFLSEFTECPFTFLENMAAVHLDRAIVLNYFLRSKTMDQRLIMRASMAMEYQTEEQKALLECPSATAVWPAALSYEEEITQLFGVRFVGVPPLLHGRGFRIEVGGGYPLRKSYRWGHT